MRVRSCRGEQPTSLAKSLARITRRFEEGPLVEQPTAAGCAPLAASGRLDAALLDHLKGLDFVLAGLRVKRASVTRSRVTWLAFLAKKSESFYTNLVTASHNLPPPLRARFPLARPVASLVQMSSQKIRRVPDLLVKARGRLGLAQKELARRADIPQTVVCALEKGRRSSPGAEIKEALSRGLELDDAAKEELGIAIEHDRLLVEIERGPFAPGASLVSASLMAVHQLSDSERDGLESRVRRSVRSKEHLRRLEADTDRDPPEEEEASMI